MTISDQEIKALMRESLEQGLSAERARTVGVRELQQYDFGGESSFAVKRLRVVLDDGESLAVFFKDLNPIHQVIEARSIRRLGLERSRRELWMYREILDAERLGTPRFYGHRWEPKRGLLWLFIEDVGPKRLSRLGEFGLWVAASQRLAKLHVEMQAVPQMGAGLLLRHDSARFRKSAEQLAEASPALSAEQRAIVHEALDRFRDVVDSIDEQPWGVIHGEYFGKNVIIRPDSPNRQIAVIDWETAAYGPLCRDLVDISAGRWTSDQRLMMWRAYYDEYCRCSGRVLAWNQFSRDVSNMALAQAIGWLAWWSKGDDKHISRWIKELQRSMSEMRVR